MNWIYLILAILFGVVGVVQCVRWSSSGTITIGYLLNFVPTVAFLVAYGVSRNISRKAVHIVAIPLCLLALGFWGFVTLGVEMFIDATTEVTDVRKYADILNDYWSYNQDLVSHFPRPIPSDADGVRFSFLPAFLQGGAHIQLRYSSLPNRISELYDHFAAEKTKSFVGGDTNDHMNMKGGMPTTFFYTSGSDSHEFPDDYEIIIFDKVLKEEDRPQGHYWNHGQSHGVAISKERSEIVYWAESW